MNRSLAIVSIAAVLVAAAPLAQANDRHVQMSINIGVPGFYEPPAYYAPPPPAVVYYPAPYYVHHHHHHDDDDDDDGYRGQAYYGYGGYSGDNGYAWRRQGGQAQKPGRVNAEQIRYRERD